jgi:sterol desaturase/sphingolipid hydroxylase (fatty acid hydroxylase superfamily)
VGKEQYRILPCFYEGRGRKKVEESPVQTLSTECVVRLGCFAGVLILLAILESFAPRRKPPRDKLARWTNHLGLAAINTIAARLLLPLSAIAAALIAEERGWGLLHFVSIPEWLAVLLAVVALDLAIYGQHVLFHAMPFLWRLHMVHHADRELDASTGLRFHTLEIVVSLLIKSAAVIVLGAPALAVVIFEVLLNATSLFNHANLNLPTWLDRLLRLVLVTPDMHRIHHSVYKPETDSNFGFNLPWWDYLFGTYRAQPMEPHTRMRLGLFQFLESPVGRLTWMLQAPFLSSRGRKSIDQLPAPEAKEHRTRETSVMQ